MDEKPKCICCDGTELENGAAMVLTYLFDLGYDLPRDSYNDFLWNLRERILKEKAYRFKLPLTEIKK
jgi:hypothetical protein